MPNVVFSQHALDQLKDRGTSEDEVKKAILEGEKTPAREGRLAFRKNFPFNTKWKGRYYGIKQVMPIVVEEGKFQIVVTVYVFYFGGETHEN